MASSTFVMLPTKFKVFLRAIATCVKISEELVFLFLPNEITIQCVDNSRSSFCEFKFHNEYFESIEDVQLSREFHVMVNGKTINSFVRRLLVRLAGADSKTKCRVSLSEGVPAADPAVDSHTDPDILERDLRSPALVFELEPPKGAHFTLRLAFLDSDPYQITHDPAGETCTIGAQAKVFHNALAWHGGDDLILTATQNGLLLKTCSLRTLPTVDVEAEMLAGNGGGVHATKKKAPLVQNSGGAQQVLRSSVQVATEEFAHYRLEAEASEREPTLCLSLKHFRSFLWFGESMNMPLQLRFSDSSQPMKALFEEDSRFSGQLVISASDAPEELNDASVLESKQPASSSCSSRNGGGGGAPKRSSGSFKATPSAPTRSASSDKLPIVVNVDGDEADEDTDFVACDTAAGHSASSTNAVKRASALFGGRPPQGVSEPEGLGVIFDEEENVEEDALWDLGNADEVVAGSSSRGHLVGETQASSRTQHSSSNAPSRRA